MIKQDVVDDTNNSAILPIVAGVNYCSNDSIRDSNNRHTLIHLGEAGQPDVPAFVTTISELPGSVVYP